LASPLNCWLATAGRITVTHATSDPATVSPVMSSISMASGARRAGRPMSSSPNASGT